jgi:hypothetical protein
MVASRVLAVVVSIFVLLTVGLRADGNPPVVFWQSDSLKPGDAVLLYGDGLASAATVKVWSVGDSATAAPGDAPADAATVPTYQPTNASVKFLLPASLPPGVFAAQVPGGKPVILNRPLVWFLQPEVLAPGLVENQAPPGAKVQIIGKDFILPDDSAKPVLEIRPVGSGGAWSSVPLDQSEKFSLRATLPASATPGDYELRISNGHGGEPGYSAPFAFTIKAPDVWPADVFDVKKMGAKGDDVTDDTAAIKSALDAAEKNGGGVVYFPWGTYRLTDAIRIPPKTILRGEDRDATILKWPVDEPKTEADFTQAAIYGDTSYGVENLSFIARKVNQIFVDLSQHNDIAPEMKPHVNPEGSHDVFFRHVAFHHWMHCSHPDRNAALWAKRYTDNENPFNFHNGGGAIRNFEVSDCLFQGANQAFFNLRNARILRNSFSNGMGYCWTDLGGGAWYTVAEGNELVCSSSWGYGGTGMKYIYSAHNISHNFVHGEREAMTLDISATPSYTYTLTPNGIKLGGKPNDAWYGSPTAVSDKTLTFDGIRADQDEFVGKAVFILDGPGAGQYRVITANQPGDPHTAIPPSPKPSADPTAPKPPPVPLDIPAKGTPAQFTIDRAWDVPPTSDSVVGIWDLMRHMIVYDCEGYDTSAFNQLYGSFYDFTVDSCKVDRSQGAWGQSGWFVQYRYNTIRYGFSYHERIGQPGPNPEHNSPFGYTGLADGNLRVTKFGSDQYNTPGGRAFFVRDVAPHPVPGVRACILKGNELEYNQRLVLLPGRDPMGNARKDDYTHMVDCLIDGNTVKHSETGIYVGGLVNNVLISNNKMEDVTTPVTANPAAVVTVPNSK